MRLTSTCSLVSNRKRGKATTRQSPPGRRQENGKRAQAAGPFVLAVDLGRKLADALCAASFMLAISGEIDVERIVEEWGQGRFLTTVPRSPRKVWGRSAESPSIGQAPDSVLGKPRRSPVEHGEIYPPEGYSEVTMPEGRFSLPGWSSVGRWSIISPAAGVDRWWRSVIWECLINAARRCRNGGSSVGRWLRDLELKPLARCLIAAPCARRN